MKNFFTTVFTKKYIFDGLLIVFSVLFALFINKIAENIQVANEKEIAMENIKKEIQRNTEIIEDWISRHTEIRDRITMIIEGKNDSLRTELLNYKYLKINILTSNQTLIEANLSNTAWETAKSTGIISEFDFNTTQKFTKIYMVQEMITEKTLVKVFDFLFDPSAHDMKNIDATLIQLQLRFMELVGQEILLKDLYKQVLANPAEE
ncbi:MAG: hypothetical protein ACNS60_13680 [Candidatus Cyclobacteriaceae bacterium M2_1C_046]